MVTYGVSRLSPLRGLALVVSAALATCGGAACVRAKAVIGPDNTPHWLITCPGGQERCLSQAGKRCPEGYDIVTHGTQVSGNKEVTSSSTELLVKCKEGGVGETGGDKGRKFAAGQAPEGALGYRFRINQLAAQNRCSSQGYQAEARESEVRCPGLPKEIGLRGFVDLTFCGSDLCEIEAISPVDADDANAELKTVLARLERQYGPPTSNKRVGPAVCAREMLPTCLADGRASMTDTWTWETGPQVVLSLSEHQGKLAIRITYRTAAVETKELPSVDGL